MTEQTISLEEAIDRSVSSEDRAVREEAQKAFKQLCLAGKVTDDVLKKLLSRAFGGLDEDEVVEAGSDDDAEMSADSASDAVDSSFDEADEINDLSAHRITNIPAHLLAGTNDDIEVAGLSLLDLLAGDPEGEEDSRLTERKAARKHQKEEARMREVEGVRVMGLLEIWLQKKPSKSTFLSELPLLLIPLLFSPSTPTSLATRIGSILDSAWRPAFSIEHKSSFKIDEINEVLEIVAKTREASSQLLQVAGRVFAKIFAAMEISPEIYQRLIDCWISEKFFKRTNGVAFFDALFSSGNISLAQKINWPSVIKSPDAKTFRLKQLITGNLQRYLSGEGIEELVLFRLIGSDGEIDSWKFVIRRMQNSKEKVNISQDLINSESNSNKISELKKNVIALMRPKSEKTPAKKIAIKSIETVSEDKTTLTHKEKRAIEISKAKEAPKVAKPAETKRKDSDEPANIDQNRKKAKKEGTKKI